MGERDSRHLPAVSPGVALALGTCSLLPFVAFDVARSSVATRPSAWLFAGLLSCVLGGGLALATSRITRPAWLAAALLLPAPLLGLPVVWWALLRTVELYPTSRVAWVLVAALGAGAISQRVLRPRLQQLGLPALSARVLASVAPAGAALAIERTLPALWDALSIGVLALGCAWASCRLLRAHLPWTVSGTLATLGGLLLTRIDPLYLGARSIVSGIVIGAALLALRDLHARYRSTVKTALVSELFMVLLLWAASATIAERMVAMDLTILRAAQGTGLLRMLVTAVQRASDADGDGYGVLFGQRDCAPFDAAIHPGNHELPGNGIDDNCQAGDATSGKPEIIAAGLWKHPAPVRCDGDIVIVLIDTLRYDSAQRPDLPALRALEAESVRFERAYATASFTVQSVLAVLTGHLSSAVSYTWTSPHDAIPVMVPTTLFERLRDAGFDTALVGGVGDGFGPSKLGRGARVLYPQTMDADTNTTTRNAQQAWRELAADKPKLLYVHYMAVHAYEWDTTLARREAYEARVARTDAALGTLRKTIGLGATWIVLADHGESFGLHGVRGHSTTIYEEVLHVPLYLSSRCLKPAIVKSVTSLLQVGPTVLAMAGALPTTGAALGPFLCLAETPCVDVQAPIALHHRNVHLHGLIDGHLQLIRDVTSLSELSYDLSSDPEERHPMSVVPEVLHERLQRWEEEAMHEHAQGVWPER